MSTDPKRSTILVTGGAGYIGSHTCIELLKSDFNVVVVDNLVNASKESLERVKEITGKAVTFIKGDVRDTPLMNTLFQQHHISVRILTLGFQGSHWASGSAADNDEFIYGVFHCYKVL